MADIKDFESEKIVRKMRKRWNDFENKSPEKIALETYKGNLIAYATGRASTYYYGWLSGVEYMMELINIDYLTAQKEVRQEIIDKKWKIVNPDAFQKLYEYEENKDI